MIRIAVCDDDMIFASSLESTIIEIISNEHASYEAPMIYRLRCCCIVVDSMKKPQIKRY